MKQTEKSFGYRIIRLLLLIFGFLLVQSSPLALMESWAADSKETIRIGGTGAALGGMNALREGFRKIHPQGRVTIMPSLGSSGGIKALLAGMIDLALSVRLLNKAELQEGMTAFEYASSPLLFVTAHTMDGFHLTNEKMVAIYEGQIKTWPNGSPFRLIMRPERETDTKILESISPEMERAVHKAFARKGILIAITDQENAALLEKMEGAFGTCTLGQILSEKRALKPFPLNGVIPSLQDLKQGIYPYAKSFFVIRGPRSSPLVKDFIVFMESAEGKAILTQNGYLVSGRDDGRR